MCAVIRIGEDEVLVAAVADGAGTAEHSAKGAALAVDRFVREFADAARSAPDLAAVDHGFAIRWVASARNEIAALAQDEGNLLRDYACTLLGAVVGPTRAAYFQIGDGAIIVSDGERDEYSWVFWPQHGEFANTTNFLTQEDAEEALDFEASASAAHEIALFSDGLERLVLDHTARTVHSPAFTPIFRWLAGTAPEVTTAASPALVAYLSSDHVNRRTDDDKSLVMATRLPPDSTYS